MAGSIKSVIREHDLELRSAPMIPGYEQYAGHRFVCRGLNPQKTYRFSVFGSSQREAVSRWLGFRSNVSGVSE